MVIKKETGVVDSKLNLHLLKLAFLKILKLKVESFVPEWSESFFLRFSLLDLISNTDNHKWISGAIGFSY